jgi:outer membrane receptor protein involved in Fe transport
VNTVNKTPLAHAISLAIAAAALGAANPALAQEQETSASSQDQSLEEIVVTGSRIRRDTYSAPQPMDVIAPEQAFVQGVGSVSALLQSATTAAGSPQVTAATSTAFVQGGGVGAQTLSLRGLGANRTLVLLNGRRAGPAGTRGEVSSFDFNVLPLSVIERVEILKDGASSIYGSDAVAGVVNIITKKDEGLDLDAYYGAPQRDGGEEARFNMSWGKNFDRGRFRITGDYHKEYELTQGDRSWFRCAEQYIFSPTTGERRDVVDPRTNSPACRDLPWGHVWLYNYQYIYTDENGGLGNVPRFSRVYAQYDYDNNLGNYIPPIAVDPNSPWYLSTPPGWYIVNYNRASDAVTNSDHPFQDGQSLIPEIERTTFFADGEFDVTDDLTAYGEVLLNRRKTKANGYRQFWTYLYSENFDFGTGLDGGGGDPRAAGWRGAMFFSPLAITDHSDNEITVNYQRFVGGLRGKIGEKWNWEASAQYSKSDGDYESDQIYNDAIEEWGYFGGWVGSCVGEVTSVRGVPCVDVPWFDPQFLAGNITGDVRDFLFGVEKGNTEYTQWTAEAYVTGPIFDLPAGPVSIAAGVQYQEDEIRDVPGEITLAGNVWGSTSAGITEGDDSSQAVFAEVEIPLVAGKPFMEALTLTASGRYTEVDSYGSGDTYKVGINWQINESWRLRASQGTSFRAPALFELYLADQTSFIGQRGVDPCINWGTALEDGEISDRTAQNCAADGIPDDYSGGAASVTVVTGGGAGVLEAETSESQTVGIVWTPKFAELSVSLDYFNIEVEDEVGQLSASEIVGGCYDSEFFPTDPLCNLFNRDSLLAIDTVRDSYLNINSQKNEGLDLSAIWRTPVGEMGVLTLETQHTYQLTQERALFEGTLEDLNGLVGEPKWVGRLNTTFERGPWSFFWGMNFIGKSDSTRERASGNDLFTYRGEQVRVVVKTDKVIYHSASLTRQFDGGLKAIVGISNVFDEEPPRVTTFNTGAGISSIGNSAFYSQYDWYGRRFFVNVTKSF